MTLPRVHLHEEVMREGMQIESVDISTDEKLELLDALSRTGLRWINVGSFVSPNYTPQMAHIDELLARFVPAPGVHYTALALNQKGRDRAAAYPFIESPPLPPTLIAHLCDTFVRRNANQRQRDEIDRWPLIADMAIASKAATGGIGVNAAWGSNFEGKFSLDERMGMLERAHRVWDERGVPVRFLMLGDPMSWNTPGTVAETVRVALGHWPEIDSVYLHLHDARGMAVASIYAAIQECGERDLHLDTTVGGIRGCPYCGNGRATGMAATEDVVHLAESMGISTGIDLDALIEVIPLLERIIGRAVPGHVGHAGPRPTAERLYDENLPLAETFEEAQHFRVGKTAFGIPHRPWREPIPARRPAQKRRDVTKGLSQ